VFAGRWLEAGALKAPSERFHAPSKRFQLLRLSRSDDLIRRLGLLLVAGGVGLFACRIQNAGEGIDGTPASPSTDFGAAGRPIARDVLPGQEIKRRGNRLRHERSLYLRQHAHNPMDWFPWGDEALALARKEDKPIFLSVGYASCHWCHVMERNVFESEEVAEFMNRHFINIKVDREDRPDLDAIYMDALQRMTGSGGWPMSMFLSPKQTPFYGSTYVPRERFRELAQRILREFRENRASVESQGARLKELISKEPDLDERRGVSAKDLARVVDVALREVDHKWGGFQNRIKFPTPPRWRFLLHYYRKTGHKPLGQALRLMLDQMASGGMFDHLDGGFHRYATEPSWMIPHFEKMLYDNAQLAALYCEAFAVFGDERYGESARLTLDFILERLSGPDGELYASYDADSDKKEGSYYLWTPDQINRAAGKEDGPLLARLLGVTAQGNFEGSSVLSRRTSSEDLARDTGRSAEALRRLYRDKWRPRLRAARSDRSAPRLDKKVVASWNGLALGALAHGYRVFGDERYRRAAERAADYLLRVHHRGGGRLYRSSAPSAEFGGKTRAEHEAILDDYAFVMDGLLELFDATGDTVHLERALLILAHAVAHFRDSRGGYFLTPKGHETPLGRQVQLRDWAEPSGVGVMLSVLLRLGLLTAAESLVEEVDRTLARYGTVMGRQQLAMALFHDVALRRMGPFYETIIAGDKSQAQTRRMLRLVARGDYFHVVTMWVPAGGPKSTMVKLLPTIAGKSAHGGKPTAFVCQLGSCRRPTQSLATLKAQLSAGWKVP
jgi:uncharacterized protein YyaL (SSP411 family)